MESLKSFLLALGIPGLFVIVVLDSAGVPMPGGPDAVVMLLSWQRPAWVPIVALTAALGSTLGCYFLYLVGKKSGDIALRRFDAKKREGVEETLRRNEVLALLAAVLGPPPFPTKIFILTAGAVHMSWKRFVVTVFSGRAVRYLAEGYLGARFGDDAAEILRTHYPAILIAVLGLAAIVLVLRHFLQSRQADAT